MLPIDQDLFQESDEELINVCEVDTHGEEANKDDYNVEIRDKKINVFVIETAVVDQIQIEWEVINDKEKLLADYSEYDDNLNAGGIDLSNNNVSGIIESEVETETNRLNFDTSHYKESEPMLDKE